MSNNTNQHLLSNILIIVVVIVALMLVFVLIYNTLAGRDISISPEMEQQAMSQTTPVGRIRFDSAADLTPAPQQNTATGETGNDSNEAAPGVDGQAVYDRQCIACHGTGLPAVPQLGAADDWSSRIALGIEVLYDRAINGYTGDSGMAMPAKGGNAALSDDEVRAAVDYMVNNSR